MVSSAFKIIPSLSTSFCSNYRTRYNQARPEQTQGCTFEGYHLTVYIKHHVCLIMIRYFIKCFNEQYAAATLSL